MSIEDELTTLVNTKSAIKNSIENHGIETTNVFSSYANNIDAITQRADIDLSNLSATGQAILDDKISKSTTGTITGNFVVENNAPIYYLDNESAQLGTAPSEVKWSRLIIRDKNDVNMGFLGHRQGTDNGHSMRFVCRKPDNTADTAIVLGFTLSGSPYCTFPNSTCVDGQIVKKTLSLASDVAFNTTTAVQYSLSNYLPNDNFIYEVFMYGRVQTGTTNGDRAVLSLASDVLSSYRVIETQTRAAGSVIASSTAIIPVGTGRTINVEAVTAGTGTYSILLNGYRRIGTNA